MTYFKDACVCIVVSVLMLLLAGALESKFFDELVQSSLEVMCGIFAINIASTALIAELIHKISEKTGASFSKSRSTLRRELKIQAMMIVCTVLLMVVYYIDYASPHVSINLIKYKTQITFVSEVGILSVFLYFVWITYDLAKALFAVLGSNLSKDDKEEGK
jgi:hypothetical protein